MHGRTFRAITPALSLMGTVWTPGSPHRGKAGFIIAKRGEPRKGKGEVEVLFSDGVRSWEPYHFVPLGDNSKQE